MNASRLYARLRGTRQVLLAIVVLVVGSAVAQAHTGSVAFWRVVVEPPAVHSDVVVAAEDLPADATAAGDLVQRHFVLAWQGESVPARVVSVTALAAGFVQVRLAHTTPGDAASLSLRSRFTELTDDSHRVFVRVVRAGVEDTVILDVARSTWSLEAPVEGHRRSVAPTLLAMVRSGIDHILTGWDHLVFLACLILPGGRWWATVSLVSAFTVAHSLTLVLAALGIVTVPVAFVEPAIALSVAYVALENLLAGRGTRDAGTATAPHEVTVARVATVFGFGLVHGLGFASLLEPMELPTGHWLRVVVAFNAGVELGQLALVGVALPLILHLARTPWHRPVTRVASVAALSVALFWFVERLP